MSKTGKTYVASEKIFALVTKLEIPTEEKKGWTLCGKFSTGGPRIYIPKTKNVGRIDLSAFTVEGSQVTDLGGERFGNVKQQVNFALPEAEILANVENILTHMLTLEKPAKVARKSPEKKASEPASSPTEPSLVVASSPEVKPSRMELLKAAMEKHLSSGMSGPDAAIQAQADVDAK